MSLFSFLKKRTHREEYEEAKEDVKYKRLASWNMGGGHPQSVYDRASDDVYEAERILKILYNEGHKEALKLDKKYHKLTARLRRDADALAEFESTELGMRHGSHAKRNVGTVAGIISIASFILASFLAVNATGNVIGANGNLTSNFTLLAIGLVFGIAWLVLKR